MTESSRIVEVLPEGSLELLSQHEVRHLQTVSTGPQHEVLRCCALAVLNVGSRTDNAREVMRAHTDFDVRIDQRDGGLTLTLIEPPEDAFVDGEMIRGIRELLFAVVRDVIFITSEYERAGQFDYTTGSGVTNAIFHILRNAGIFRETRDSRLVVCWGGHAISREEYEYTKEVGYHLGLRFLNVCTGCGAGAMKGPMKGATIGHAKQRFDHGHYIGLTEPDIIAAESPNPIVNQLVIMPDMEKRLEAFIRIAHGIVIFPGGVGTAEEILFLLGTLMQPENEGVPLPVVMTGPESARGYFEQIDQFIDLTLGDEARRFYRITIGDPSETARVIARQIDNVISMRRIEGDAPYFNWKLKIDAADQRPFVATHENMAALNLDKDQQPHVLATNLRRAFSGLVAGNVKEYGIRSIEEHGPFEIRGDRRIMSRLDTLLSSFVEDQRMHLSDVTYKPCYRIVV